MSGRCFVQVSFIFLFISMYNRHTRLDNFTYLYLMSYIKTKKNMFTKIKLFSYWLPQQILSKPRMPLKVVSFTKS